MVWRHVVVCCCYVCGRTRKFVMSDEYPGRYLDVCRMCEKKAEPKEQADEPS